MILGSPATQQISKSQTFDYWISDIAWLNLYDKMVKFPIWPHPHLLFLAGPDFDGELTALDQQLGVCKRCHAFSMIFSHVGQNSLFFLKNWDISHFESGGWLPNLETPERNLGFPTSFAKRGGKLRWTAPLYIGMCQDMSRPMAPA